MRCSDVVPPGEAFEASKALLPAESRGRVTYAVGAAAERLEDARGAETAIVDPPRKGLDAALLKALAEPEGSGPCAGLTTLIYVSCGFPALRTDADALLAAGWTIQASSAAAHILFYGANHIESVPAVLPKFH